MSRMFEVEGKRVKTWNSITGCKYVCTYCWARHLAETRLKHLPQYANGFKPHVDYRKMDHTVTKGTIFVGSMGDMWGPWVPINQILDVLYHVRNSPNATFLLLTKNPARYLEFMNLMPPNVVLGTTIESNRRYPKITKAPPPWERCAAMLDLKRQYPALKRFVSIEPIMEFDHVPFLEGLQAIKPAFVYVGYDSAPKRNHLPEPPLAKTRALIAALEAAGIEVREKHLREAHRE